MSATDTKNVDENPWGVEDDGPATKVPSHSEALAYLRQKHAEFKARQAEYDRRA